MNDEKKMTTPPTGVTEHLNDGVLRKKLIRKRDERYKRMMKVKHLFFVRKWSIGEIAELLGLNKATVARDIALIRKTSSELATADIEFQTDIKMFFWELKDRYEARVKRLWSEYQTAPSKQRVLILKEIREQEKQFIETLQSVGILKKAATQINVDKQSKELKILFDLSEDELKEKLKSLIDEDVIANPIVDNVKDAKPEIIEGTVNGGIVRTTAERTTEPERTTD